MRGGMTDERRGYGSDKEWDERGFTDGLRSRMSRGCSKI